MTDSERLDELFKYFQSTTAVIEHDIDSSAEYLPSAAILSNDPVLNALAQLGVCRLNYERGFVSLIDNKNQYVVAEVTKSGSLYDVNHHPGDAGIAVGVRALDLVTGVCAEPKYQFRPYVQQAPFMRYYAGVAIRTSSGHVIGTYAVIDNSPHNGLDDESFLILTEIASSIMKHIELLRTQTRHTGALKLLRGLKDFGRGNALVNSVEGKKSRAQYLNGDSMQEKNLSATKNDLKQVSRATVDSVLEGLASEGHDNKHQAESALLDTNEDLITASPTQTASRSSTSRARDPLVSSARKGQPSPKTSPVVASNQYQDVLKRAVDLIRVAMSVDEVFFVKQPPLKGTAQELVPDLVTSDIHTNAPPKVTGVSFNTGKPDSVAHENCPIDEHLHHLLRSEYPRGHYFNFTNYDLPEIPTMSRKATITRLLRQSLPLARSLLYVPINTQKMTGAMRSLFAWTAEKRRLMQDEDLSYLGLFGAAIEAEFSRIEILTQDRAKSDFISSISHELRSPLHGILGNTEILLDSKIDDDQEEMIVMIEKCGRSLLSTMDHILTYSKINSSTRPVHLPQNKDNTTAPVDVSMVVEDTVDTLVAGNNFRKLSIPEGSPPDEKTNPYNLSFESTTGIRPHVFINLIIDKTVSLTARTNENVWARCLTNILGNSMKYTERGCIEIRLESIPIPLQIATGGATHRIKLSVRDTGRGISPKYLEDHLYGAFLQENTSAQGLGLGLNIVKKLVDEIGGMFDVKSALGQGTTVEISAPVLMAPVTDTEIPVALLQCNKKICLVGLLSQQDLAVPTFPYEHPAAVLGPTIALYCKQLPNCQVCCSARFEDSDADIRVVFDGDGQVLQSLEINKNSKVKHPLPKALVVVGSSGVMANRANNTKAAGIFHLQAPFGPRRLFSILLQASKYTTTVNGFSKSNPESTIKPNTQQVTPSAPQPTDPSILLRRQSLIANTDPLTKRVLIVDDNEINLKLLAKCLERWCISYKTASNGAEAVEAYRQAETAYDYILMDISMPVMNGLQATRAIREMEAERNREYPRTRIVALTGLGDENTQQEAFISGVDVFLKKPVKLLEVKELLRLK